VFRGHSREGGIITSVHPERQEVEVDAMVYQFTASESVSKPLPKRSMCPTSRADSEPGRGMRGRIEKRTCTYLERAGGRRRRPCSMQIALEAFLRWE
jgi:hypothetical protein